MCKSAGVEAMAGAGARWQSVLDMFELHRRRLGYELAGAAGTPLAQRDDRPGAQPWKDPQGSLFD